MSVEFEENHWMRYWDGIAEMELKADMGRAAGADVIATQRKMQVWIKVDRGQCFREAGKPPIKLRCVEVNKGEKTKPNHRRRIVVKDMKTNNRPECSRQRC